MGIVVAGAFVNHAKSGTIQYGEEPPLEAAHCAITSHRCTIDRRRDHQRQRQQHEGQAKSIPIPIQNIAAASSVGTRGRDDTAK